MIIGTSFLTRDDASFVKMVLRWITTRVCSIRSILKCYCIAEYGADRHLRLPGAGLSFCWFLAKLPHKVRPLLLFLLIVRSGPTH